MPAYNIVNFRGDPVATINVGTTTGNTFPILLIGQGISDYGGIIASTQYHLTENFAGPTPPDNSIEGQLWYNTESTIQNFFDGSNYIPLSGANSSSSSLFNMATTATNIDFTTEGVTALFQSPNTGQKYYPTSILLIPNGPVLGNGAVFNLLIDSSEDVMDNSLISNVTDQKHVHYSIEGTTRFAENDDVISLEVSTAAIGGSLAFDVLLFGYTRF